MKKTKIMCVVDDNMMIRRYVSMLIRRNKKIKKLLYFESASQALKYLTEKAAKIPSLPDFILLDLDMPEMSGWEFLDNFDMLQPGLSKTIDVYIHSYSASTAQAMEAKKHPSVKQIILKPINHLSLDIILAA